MLNTRNAILNTTDYYPFGMAIKSRSNALDASTLYNYGFGGQQIPANCSLSNSPTLGVASRYVELKDIRPLADCENRGWFLGQ